MENDRSRAALTDLKLVQVKIILKKSKSIV